MEEAGAWAAEAEKRDMQLPSLSEVVLVKTSALASLKRHLEATFERSKCRRLRGAPVGGGGGRAPAYMASRARVQSRIWRNESTALWIDVHFIWK